MVCVDVPFEDVAEVGTKKCACSRDGYGIDKYGGFRGWFMPSCQLLVQEIGMC